jgi:alkylhydroperoxidase family enzyme
MHERYKDQVQFVAVYVREAHPTDGWRMPTNDRVGITLRQPRSAAEREGVAGKCCALLEMRMPLVVDGLDDRVGHAYSGMPDRLYVIDREGRVAYQGGRGPFGFKPREMEQALVLLQLDEKAAPAVGRFPLLPSAVAWKRLPPAEQGPGQPLPSWARALAGPLPRTTAAMLELDFAQRARSPLDPKLRGRLRWEAARANGCARGAACALADLRRAGLGETEIQALGRDEAGRPEAERAALAFARKMMRAADTVTDAEVAGLLKHFGDKQTVAIVLLLAYANFQDRLLLHLGLGAEASEALPPLEVRFRKKDEKAGRQPAGSGPVRKGPPPAATPDDEAAALALARLQEKLEAQRQRPPRIRVPTWDELRKQGAPERPDPLRIRWSLVCSGYQPELARGWFGCLRTFAEEAAQDRVLEESVFWVLTRRLNCFY